MTAIARRPRASVPAPAKPARKPRAPRKPAPFDWAAFWAEQPDLPVVLAFRPVATVSPDPVPLGERSVVARSYKVAYSHNGTKGRGCGDALYDFLLTFLDGDGRLDVVRFEALLAENGVDHTKWNRTTPGWQGRLRMSGSVVLRNRIKRGEPVLWNGHAIPA